MELHQTRCKIVAGEMWVKKYKKKPKCVRNEKIMDAASYLKSFIHGISICKRDKDAKNGGATEPHVSYMLAERLSSRPMKWSKTSLERFAPILVSDGNISFENNLNDINQNELYLKAVCVVRTAFKYRKTAGLPSLGSIGALPVLNAGKTTTRYKALKGLLQRFGHFGSFRIFSTTS